MKKYGIILSFCLLLSVSTYASSSDSSEDKSSKNTINSSNEEEGHSIGHKLVLYIPNRILDVFDIMRLRLRVGPGISVGARATEYISAYVGSYTSIYAGLPGPRMRPMPKSPVGLESYSGASVSVVDATVDGGIGPGYSPTEFDLSFQLLILGLDVGMDPVEVVDFAGGFFLWDPRKDDL